MKQFKWRLQSVLDVREKQQQVKRVELFELTRQLDHLNKELDLQKKILTDMIDNLAGLAPKDRLEKQKVLMNHIKTNDEVIRTIESDIQKIQTERKEKIAEVVELKKQTEGLGKLRAEAKMQYLAEQEKRQQAAADEITTYRFARERLGQHVVDV